MQQHLLQNCNWELILLVPSDTFAEEEGSNPLNYPDRSGNFARERLD